MMRIKFPELPFNKTVYLMAVMLLTAGMVSAHEGHDHGPEPLASPLLASLRAQFGATHFKLGPVSKDSLNTLVIHGEARASIPVCIPAIRRLSILHTGINLEEVAECRIAIKYKDLDAPVIQPWHVHDWQAQSVHLPEKDVLSGIWWYQRGRGLVMDDARAKIYVANIEVESSRRIESISLIVPKLSKGNVRVYALAALTVGAHAWTAIDMSKQFNLDTILFEPSHPADDRMYFAMELTELLTYKK